MTNDEILRLRESIAKQNAEDMAKQNDRRVDKKFVEHFSTVSRIVTANVSWSGKIAPPDKVG